MKKENETVENRNKTDVAVDVIYNYRRNRQRRLNPKCIEGSIWWCRKKGREMVEEAGLFVPRNTSNFSANAESTFPC